MFEFVDDIERRVLNLQQKHNTAVTEFQHLLQNYQTLKNQHQELLENNKQAHARLEKLLHNLPAELSDSLANTNNQD